MPGSLAFVTGSSDMAARIRAHDWASTPIGDPADWPVSLRWVLGLCLSSNFPTSIYWGPERILLYNDAWAPIPGPRHPEALGRPARDVWSDIWHIIEPQFDRVVSTGDGFATFDQFLPMERFGAPEETYWDYSFTPIVGDDGSVVGILNQGRDVTVQIVRGLHDRFMLRLDAILLGEAEPQLMIDAALDLLRQEFGVARVGYCEIDHETSEVDIQRCTTDGRLSDISGRLPLETFGRAFSEALRGGKTIRVDNSRADPIAQGEQVVAACAAIGIEAGMVAPQLTDGNWTAALFAHSPEPRRWLDHEAAIMESTVGRLWREVSRARAGLVLRDSEERHRLVFEQARDMIFTADLDQIITACNPATASALDMPIDGLTGRSIAEFVSPEDFERTGAMLRQKLADGGSTGYDVEVVAPSGKRMNWEVNSTLSRDRDGRPTGLHAIARDVTERRAFDERQALLINELNHRVKNTLALVQALALQSIRADRDPIAGVADFQLRLAALSSAHDLLTVEQWEGATLGELVNAATNPLRLADSRISGAGPDVQVRPKAAVSIIMALHELTTNALKYGALASEAGRVEIGWSVSDGRLHLNWREQGGPAVAHPEHRGFGIRMIERALATDLAGKATIDFAPDGLVCTILAPLDGDTRTVGRA